ncbi:HAMP domain-containing sensor histidine kinase [Chamaesiphon sp. VAR_48_metabat_403]|uniref:sensor histidine kinase n=1 Tax=Chamaesiphon sp. VAR_48_metabat_403 TaxID=2964700 RepID=UPI00286DB091|nr:HAMP domain-containing sensor histidine kinase [Chamaesiphon sp. VAR_48_metabat_403]
MAINSCLDNREHLIQELDPNSFFDLQAEQIADLQPIFFTRIVHSHPIDKKNLEVIAYSKAADRLSSGIIDYLRSEQWLVDYPEAFTVDRIELPNPAYFGYFCLWGYRNSQPEYIQVIADRPLSPSLQVYLQKAAMSIDKYGEMCRDCSLQRSESQLLQEIFQNVSHQLRNSISLISLCAHNLRLGLPETSPVGAQAQIVCDGIQNLDLSLTELLDCSQSQLPRLVPQDLRKLVDESLERLQPLIAHKQLKVTISETSTLLTVDRSQMQQVFDNLLSNAVHFSPISGTITCSWQIFQGEVLINISDEGTGLSPEDLQKIFNPFYSRRAGGTGLGLTIAKKIVLGHQGSLWAQNIGSKGAKFSLILPR